jgi:hypothetical protein
VAHDRRVYRPAGGRATKASGSWLTDRVESWTARAAAP